MDCIEIENSVSYFYSDFPIISYSLLSFNLITITVSRSKRSFNEDITVLNSVLSVGHIADRGLPLAYRKG